MNSQKDSQDDWINSYYPLVWSCGIDRDLYENFSRRIEHTKSRSKELRGFLPELVKFLENHNVSNARERSILFHIFYLSRSSDEVSRALKYPKTKIAYRCFFYLMGDAFFYTERFKREFRDCYRADLWHWDAMMLTEGEGVEFPQSDKNKRRLPSFYLDHIESCPRCESLRQQFVEKRDFFLHKLRQVPSSEIVYEKKKSWQKTYSVWSLVFRLSWQSAVSLLLFWLIVKVPAIQFWMADFIRKLST